MKIMRVMVGNRLVWGLVSLSLSLDMVFDGIEEK